MKRGQLAAVIIIVLLVAVVGAFVVFSDKRAGHAPNVALSNTLAYQTPTNTYKSPVPVSITSVPNTPSGVPNTASGPSQPLLWVEPQRPVPGETSGVQSANKPLSVTYVPNTPSGAPPIWAEPPRAPAPGVTPSGPSSPPLVVNPKTTQPSGWKSADDSQNPVTTTGKVCCKGKCASLKTYLATVRFQATYASTAVGCKAKIACVPGTMVFEFSSWPC